MKRAGFQITGFTLLELLCASAVLMIVVALLLQVLFSASNLLERNRATFSADARAHAVLALLDQEIRNGVFRSDLAAFPAGRLEFHTRGAGGNGGRGLSLVGYRVDPTRAALQRASSAVDYHPDADGAAVVFGETESLPYLPPQGGSGWGEVAWGILAVDVRFLRKDGSWDVTGLSDPRNPVQGALLAVAALDERSEERLAAAGRLAELAGHSVWTDPPAQGLSRASHWRQATSDEAFDETFGGFLPHGIRIVERYVPLAF